jgi:hypothetical protein
MKQGDILPRDRHGLLRSFGKFRNGNGLRVVHEVVVGRCITPSRKPLLPFPQIRELFVPSRLSVPVPQSRLVPDRRIERMLVKREKKPAFSGSTRVTLQQP